MSDNSITDKSTLPRSRSFHDLPVLSLDCTIASVFTYQELDNSPNKEQSEYILPLQYGTYQKLAYEPLLSDEHKISDDMSTKLFD
ncbi:hypothetical protein WOLCODRAFT_159663, partial [Wolfiporia cocos MD-104 SS10]